MSGEARHVVCTGPVYEYSIVVWGYSVVAVPLSYAPI